MTQYLKLVNCMVFCSYSDQEQRSMAFMKQIDFEAHLPERFREILSDPAFGSREGTGVYGKGQEKVRSILFEAIGLLAEEGPGGFSMRRVAERLNKTVASIQHYFPSHDALMAAMGRFFTAFYKRQQDMVLNADYATDLDRLEAYIDFSLDRASGDPIMFAMLSEAQTGSPQMAGTLRDIYELDVTRISALLEPLTPHLSTQERKARAAFLSASMDGLEIYLSKTPPLTPRVSGLRKHSKELLMKMVVA